MRKIRIIGAVALVFCACSLFAQKSKDEESVWKLEHAYWEDVKTDDFVSYQALWHENSVAWPAWGIKPVRKDHITDWLGAYTLKGVHLKGFVLEPADSHETKNIVVTYYWLTADWADTDGHEQKSTIRVTHTWIRSGKSWLILGGMGSPEAKVRN